MFGLSAPPLLDFKIYELSSFGGCEDSSGESNPSYGYLQFLEDSVSVVCWCDELLVSFLRHTRHSTYFNG